VEGLTLYTFYESNGRSEELTKHGIDVLREIEKCEDLVRVIINEMFFVTHENRGEATELLLNAYKLGAICHDLGKGLASYQTKSVLTKFPGHEIPTAILLDEALQRFWEDGNMFNTDRDLNTLVELVILYPVTRHHYVSRDVKTARELYEEFKSETHPELQQVVEEYRKVFKNYSLWNRFFDYIKDVVREATHTKVHGSQIIVEMICGRYSGEIVRRVRIVKMLNKPMISEKIEALTGVLNAADRCVSRRNREGVESWIGIYYSAYPYV